MQGIVKTIKNCIETNSKMISSSNNSIWPRIVVYPNSGEYFDSRQGHRSWHTYDGEEVKVLHGEDAKEFLQNLISNDINKVSDVNSCFTSLLTQ